MLGVGADGVVTVNVIYFRKSAKRKINSLVKMISHVFYKFHIPLSH